jgi:hypothetical protein
MAKNGKYNSAEEILLGKILLTLAYFGLFAQLFLTL